MPAEELHTVAELAKAWRCSPWFIYSEIKEGRLRSVNLGTGRAKTRIPASAVQEYVDRQSRRKPKDTAA